eukprot:NODE_3332_length_1371_cov_2.624199_g2898_i0.p1 GENE.NODE_3332_length_1371_cov_2.624199_g2898_i0~~NODE_3332_length_1371_cov_2.624199_g2898_i0.p1  ORF type:complete len:366 (+),score=31.09 NODE_3332_length_1371_cov_2.624199_g2898_i0:59-1156(+)
MTAMVNSNDQSKGGDDDPPNILNEQVSRPKLNILIPDVVHDTNVARSADEVLSHNYAKEPYIEELLDIGKKLGFNTEIHVLDQSHLVLQHLPHDEIILNLCDGSDTDGIPGPSVALWLQEHRKTSKVFGCGFDFINSTTFKHEMKFSFRSAGVSTSNSISVTSSDIENLSEILSKLKLPLFVKVSDSYGSVGICEKSCCRDYESAQVMIKKLLETYSILVVEEFIDGPEFTVLVQGDYQNPDKICVYRPAQRKFAKWCPINFVTFDINWKEYYSTEEPPYSYVLVNDPEMESRVIELAKQAYISVRGTGYGRIDIRASSASGNLYVLEVNSVPAVGHDSSSDQILRIQGKSTLQFFSRILGLEDF